MGMFQPPPPRCTHEARMCVQATQRRLATGHCPQCMLLVVRAHAISPEGCPPEGG